MQSEAAAHVDDGCLIMIANLAHSQQQSENGHDYYASSSGYHAINESLPSRRELLVLYKSEVTDEINTIPKRVCVCKDPCLV